MAEKLTDQELEEIKRNRPVRGRRSPARAFSSPPKMRRYSRKWIASA